MQTCSHSFQQNCMQHFLTSHAVQTIRFSRLHSPLQAVSASESFNAREQLLISCYV